MTTNSPFDLTETDRLLTTTRAVRKRLDFERDVPDDLIFECIDLAEQAPSGGNDSSRRWLVVRDPATKERLGDIYRETGQFMTKIADRLEGTGHAKEKVFDSSSYLVENFAQAPVLVIAAIWGIHDDSGRPGLFDSVIQSAWSFNLALRARGLGTTWTTLLNANVERLAEELAIPDGVTTIVTFPVAYTKGTDFKAVARRPAAEITYFDRWGYTREQPSVDGTARITDGQGVVSEIDIDGRPAAVWPLISDIDMPAEFSSELQSTRWNSDARGKGASFTGDNQLGDFEWSVECHVTDYEEGSAFEWSSISADEPGAVWRLEVVEQGMGSRLRFSMLIGETNNLLAPNAQADPDREAAVINGRRKQIKANMQAVVEGVKARVEEATGA